MATESKRQRQVSSIIQRQLSEVFMNEGTYIYGDAMVTVTNVHMTPDLGLARVYLSVYNTQNKESVIDAILVELPRIRKGLAQRVRKHLRRVPNLELFLDETLDEMEKVDEMLRKIRNPGDSAE